MQILRTASLRFGQAVVQAATSSKAPGKPRRASVDTTLALDKITQRLIGSLCSAAYRRARDHLLRVWLSTFQVSWRIGGYHACSLDPLRGGTFFASKIADENG